MLTKPCPDCGDDIGVFSRKHRCGWVAAQSGAKTDPDWRLCADVSRGDRCSKPGVVSPSTHGGQFFCWQHVPGFSVFKDGNTCAPPMGFAGLRAKLKPFDFEAMLEREALQADDRL